MLKGIFQLAALIASNSIVN